MEIKKCARGHFYDAEVDSSCPQCAKEDGMVGGGGKTEPIIIGGRDSVPTGGTYETLTDFPLDETRGITGGNGFPGNTMGDSIPINDFDDDSVTMPTPPKGFSDFTPVTGWLVCIDGPAKGTDYRVRMGYNYIGRSENMDICIKGDKSISRERHAIIAYDNRSKTFFAGPVSGKTIVYLNDGMLMSSQIIKAYDRLTIGSTVLMFIPLCSKEFDWNE